MQKKQKSLAGLCGWIESLESRLLLSTGLFGAAQQIGATDLPGVVSYANGIYSLPGGKSNIGGTSDRFNFTSQTLSGDGSIVARIKSLKSGGRARAGVMFRDDADADSAFAGVFVTPGNKIQFLSRPVSGETTNTAIGSHTNKARFVKLVRTGAQLTGYFSKDGVNWTQVGETQAVALDANSLVGIAASTQKNVKNTTATMADVAVLPGGWTDIDIGSPGVPGSASYDRPSDTYTISGGGSDIWGTADQFNFSSTTMTGDGSVATFVNSITNTNSWAKAGVMIRNDSSAGSAFAAVLVSPSNGITFEWRPNAGAAASQEINSPAGGPVSAPVGLKLTRAGNSFTAYYSTDGINWIQIGPSQISAIGSTALAGMAVTSHDNSVSCTAAFSSVGVGVDLAPGAGIYSTSDQLFLDDLEERQVMSFYDDTNPNTGLVPDNVNANGGSPSTDSSIAAIGFGLTALTIGDSRGWLSDAQAYGRALTTLNFLYNHGANVNGFFYHFLNPYSGARYGSSEVSSVDTAELMAGVLNAGQYWVGTPLQTVATNLYNRVNWPWMQQASGVFYGAWTPENGFSSGGYGDFSEASLLYMIALGSPTYPASQSSWLSWSRTPVVHYGSYTFVTADDAALFTVQYPQAWFDLRGLTDSKGLNYYPNAQTATLAQRQFMIDLSSQNSKYADYGPNLWGLTPSEGPGGYTVWGGPPANGPIDGTVVPAAPGGSLEFEPRLALDSLENMKNTYGSAVYQKYGLVDAFNPRTGWTSSVVLGIDVGMMLISAENSRSNFVWDVFNQNPVARQSLAEAFPSASVSTWVPNGSGDWNKTSSWANGVIPNVAGAEADFISAVTAGHTMFSDTAITAGMLNFNVAGSMVVAGAGSLTLQSTTGDAQIIVQQGTETINLPLTIASNTVFNVAAGATLVIADPVTIDAGFAISAIGGGSVIYQSITTHL